MRFSALAKPILYSILTAFLPVILLGLSPLMIHGHAFAQQTSSPRYAEPNLNPDVPRSQHTLVQSLLIETTAAVFCALTGVDPIDPVKGCLRIDPQTQKIGYSPQSTDGSRDGGLIGFMPDMISMTFTPPVSSIDHFRYLASNFGIVEPVHAQKPNGFRQLEVVQGLWVAMRNITYLVFVFIFIIIGIGIILRVKIDPRTVMTLQNQIPRIVICVILITFSYAIVGVMIDLMWNVTQMGINVLTKAVAAGPDGFSNTNPPGCETKETDKNTNITTIIPPQSLQKRAKDNLENNPIVFGDKIFQGETESYHDWVKEIKCDQGINAISSTMGKTIKNIIYDMINAIFISNPADQETCPSIFTTYGGSIGCYLTKMLSNVMGYIGGLAGIIIIFVMVIWSLFRIWLQLLRSYIMIILYTITGPFWIIMGLLPGKPLGFEKWMRRLFANLIIFPATVLLLMLAAIMMYAFNQVKVGEYGPNMFSAPLLGNPNMKNFGYVLAFGILMAAPGLLDIIRMSVNAVGKQGQMALGAMMGTMAQGSGPMRGIGRGLIHRTFGINKWTGHANIGHQLLAGRLGAPGSLGGKWNRFYNLMIGTSKTPVGRPPKNP